MDDASSHHAINVKKIEVVPLHPYLAEYCSNPPAGHLKLHNSINGQHAFRDASTILQACVEIVVPSGN